MTTALSHTPRGGMPLSPRHLPGNDNKPRVVALAGAAGSGKSTAAQYLVDNHGFARVRFAGPLKEMCRAIGLQDEHIEGDRKEEPIAMLCGRTPRQFMQFLGTEFGRDLIGGDFWVGLWRMEAEHILDAGGRVVVDDCRFPNEAAAVRRMAGDIYRLQGRGGIAGGHESERQDFVADVVIENDGPVVDMWRQLDEALERWG